MIDRKFAMVIQQSEHQTFSEILTAYANSRSLDDHAAAVVARLTSSNDVRDIFLRVIVDRNNYNLIIDDCIIAERRMRTHNEQLTKLRSIRSGRDGAIAALKDISDFNKFIGCQIMNKAIGTLRESISLHARLAAGDLKSMSQKGDASAAISSGVSWLKSSFRQITKKANLRHVATIARIALDRDSIDIDTVNKARSNRL